MAKRSGNRGSRSERRAGRQRVERARERGLPERQDPPPRALALESEATDSDDAEPVGTGGLPARSGLPTALKVAAVATALLGAAYALTHWRDRDDAAEPAPEVVESAPAASAQPASAQPTSAPSAAPKPEPSASPEQSVSPDASAPASALPAQKRPGEPPLTAPTTPVVAVPSAPRPTPAAAKRPVVAAPAPPPAPPVAPVVPPPAAVPAPRPADNPY